MASKRNMRTIPPEIITEILYRLPTKSIGRFRSVSKSWLSQLTDPEFIKTHRNTLNQTHLIWRSSAKGSAFLHSHPFHYGETVITPSKFNVDIDKGALGISCSCDGLVLVCVYYDDDTHSAVVINPTTRETLQLPEDYCNFHEINYVDLVTDTLYGFGYDLVTDDYKVVSVTYFRYYTDQLMDDVEGVYVYVYSLRNNTWRRVIDSPYIQYITDGVFVNGFIHWIARKGRSYDDLLVITAFSLADESFSDVPSPKLCDATHMWQLFVVAGKLAIHLDVEGELWLMNEYMKQESWTRILLHEVHISRPRFGDDPMVFYDNGKILVANSNWMMVYDAEKAAFTKTVFVWNPEKLLLVGTYIESLVSLKLSKGEENTHDQDRQTGKRKDIDSSSAPLKLKLVFSSPLPGDIPGPSSSETFDPKLIPHRLEDGVPLHHAQEFALRPNLQATEAMKNTEAMRQNLQATGHVVDTLLRDIEQKNVIILDLERKVSEGYDSWKAKHLEEKLRADRLEEKVNHALRKQQFLSHRLEEKEATIQSKLAEIIRLQTFERRAREQEFTLVEKNEELLEKGRALDTANAEIESLKARLAMADQERRNAVAALQR